MRSNLFRSCRDRRERRLSVGGRWGLWLGSLRHRRMRRRQCGGEPGLRGIGGTFARLACRGMVLHLWARRMTRVIVRFLELLSVAMKVSDQSPFLSKALRLPTAMPPPSSLVVGCFLQPAFRVRTGRLPLPQIQLFFCQPGCLWRHLFPELLVRSNSPSSVVRAGAY